VGFLGFKARKFHKGRSHFKKCSLGQDYMNALDLSRANTIVGDMDLIQWNTLNFNTKAELVTLNVYVLRCLMFYTK
jgi:hypothetical protein